MVACMEAVIYTRVSQDRNDGRSVEDQERECRTECDRRGWPVRAVFRDNSISASRYGNRRPEWEKLKVELRHGDVLVVWEASRAGRDLEEFVSLRNLCAEKSVQLSYSGRVLDLTLGDDRFAGGLDALIAERESEQIRVRVLRGKRAGALEGRPAGRVPWGYRMASPGVWEPDPVEAPRIQEAVKRILAGESHNAVYRWLQTTEGHKPASLTVMCRSLRKPTLAGKRVHQGEVFGKGNWEPIISESQHTQLVGQMDRKRKTYGRLERPGPEPQHLLSYIATCAECGSGLAHRKKATGRAVYVCPKWHCSRVAEQLDKAVEDALLSRLAKVDPKQFESDDPAVGELWAGVEDLQRQLDEWIEKATAGEVTPSSFAQIEKGLIKRIDSLKAEALQHDQGDVNLADLLENWADTTVREKRDIVRGFFTITVHPAKRGSRVGLGGVDITPLREKSSHE
jgi:site-specific DNA recombinase